MVTDVEDPPVEVDQAEAVERRAQNQAVLLFTGGQRLFSLRPLRNIPSKAAKQKAICRGCCIDDDFRGSPSRLNFGDGFTYALARALDCPILCKGDDFAATGIAVIRPQ